MASNSSGVKKQLERNWTFIMENIHFNEICGSLIEKNIISAIQGQDIKSSHRSNSYMVEEILFILMRKTDEDVQEFKCILQQNHMDHIVKKMDETDCKSYAVYKGSRKLSENLKDEKENGTGRRESDESKQINPRFVETFLEGIRTENRKMVYEVKKIISEDHGATNNQIHTLYKAHNELEMKVDGKIDRNSERISKVEEKLNDLQNAIAAKETETKEKEEMLSRLKDTVAILKATNNKQFDELKNTKLAKKDIERKLENLQDYCKKLESDLQDMKEHFEKKQAIDEHEIHEKELQIAQSRTERDILITERDNYKEKCKILEKQIQEMTEELRKKQDEIEKLVKKSEAEVENKYKTQGRPTCVRGQTLMFQKHFPGLRGSQTRKHLN